MSFSRERVAWRAELPAALAWSWPFVAWLRLPLYILAWGFVIFGSLGFVWSLVRPYLRRHSRKQEHPRPTREELLLADRLEYLLEEGKALGDSPPADDFGAWRERQEATVAAADKNVSASRKAGVVQHFERRGVQSACGLAEPIGRGLAGRLRTADPSHAACPL